MRTRKEQKKYLKNNDQKRSKSNENYKPRKPPKTQAQKHENYTKAHSIIKLSKSGDKEKNLKPPREKKDTLYTKYQGPKHLLLGTRKHVSKRML